MCISCFLMLYNKAVTFNIPFFLLEKAAFSCRRGRYFQFILSHIVLTNNKKKLRFLPSFVKKKHVFDLRSLEGCVGLSRIFQWEIINGAQDYELLRLTCSSANKRISNQLKIVASTNCHKMSQFEGNRICHGLITGDMRELSQSVSFRHSRPRPKFRFGNFGVDTAEKGTIKNAMHKEDSDLSSWKRCWAAAWPVAHSPGVKERRYRYTTKRVRETILPNGAHLYSWTYSSETFVKLTFPNKLK